jgi:hypothetical protein
MTTTTALAHLGLLELPRSRADLQRQVAGRVDPRRWSWEDTAAYQCLWRELGQARRNPPETVDSSCSTPAAGGGCGQNRSNSKAFQHPTAHGVYRPGMTRRTATRRAA